MSLLYRFVRIGIVIVAVLTWSPGLLAHTSVEDDSGVSSAYVHTTPDDRPVAGEVSIITFDLKNRNVDNDTHNFYLKITSQDDISLPVSVSARDGEVSGVHTFSSPGEYELQLTTTNKSTSQKTVFNHVQTVGAITEDTNSDGNFKLLLGLGALGFATAAAVFVYIKMSHHHHG